MEPEHLEESVQENDFYGKDLDMQARVAKFNPAGHPLLSLFS